MNAIYAILNKPKGRGSDRCWRAWKIQGDNLCQADVEDFMIRMHYSTNQYFLSLGDNFTEDKYLLRFKEKNKDISPWINYEDVFFEWVEGQRTFVFSEVQTESNQSQGEENENL